LAALGEEMDLQLAKAKAKAKVEARQEAQKQMDTERKKIPVEMESKFVDLTAQMRTFEKVRMTIRILTRYMKGQSRGQSPLLRLVQSYRALQIIRFGFST
jgi:hypothetical protein